MKVAEENWAVAGRLSQLGINNEILLAAVQAGEIERSSSTELHPSSYGGYLAWGTSFASLAESLIPHGWRKVEEKNLPLVIDPVKKLAITVAAGDKNTGNTAAQPKTKNPRGPVTISRVRYNQMLLFDAVEEFAPTPPAHDRTLWMLLVYPEQRADGSFVVRSELSVPAAVDNQGHVVEWDERIILDPIEFDVVQIEDEEDFEQDVDVLVRPRE